MLVTVHVPVILVLWVLGNQAGMPLPVVPAILAAGAVSRGAGDVAGVVAGVVGAALCADVAWYGVGRVSGTRALTSFPRGRHQALMRTTARWIGERFALGRYLLYAIETSAIWASTWTAMGYVLGARDECGPLERGQRAPRQVDGHLGMGRRRLVHGRVDAHPAHP